MEFIRALVHGHEPVRGVECWSQRPGSVIRPNGSRDSGTSNEPTLGRPSKDRVIVVGHIIS